MKLMSARRGCGMLSWCVGAAAAAGLWGTAGADTVFIVSNTAHEVYKYDVPATGAVTLMATFTNAGFERPFAIAARWNGELLINERGPCTGCAGGGLTRLLSNGC